jgi:serine/threonine-protein kinase haspin
MSKTTTVRKYGKSIKRSRAEQLFAELPRSPVKRNEVEEDPQRQEPAALETDANSISEIVEKLLSVTLDEGRPTPPPESKSASIPESVPTSPPRNGTTPTPIQATPLKTHIRLLPPKDGKDEDEDEDLRILAWDDVCPFGDRVEKIAEASYAEVYRITNERGTSIIKVIRLESPIKPQTKTQQRSGLVDEEPHSETDLKGELQISEWLADIPGFVVYKERYVVKGKAPKVLLETHQAFHRKMKRKDPDRLQFYPSPSRYLDDTKFLVVELGDAGTALEGFELRSADQLWDIFLHTAIALARAENLVKFEVSDYPTWTRAMLTATAPGPARRESLHPPGQASCPQSG